MVRIHTDSLNDRVNHLWYSFFMRGNKVINYSTPKSIQATKRQHRNHNRNKKKKDKNYCVIHKGAHVFDIKETEYFFNKPWAYQWRCKCGKKGKKEYIDPPEWLKKQISDKVN